MKKKKCVWYLNTTQIDLQVSNEKENNVYDIWIQLKYICRFEMKKNILKILI